MSDEQLTDAERMHRLMSDLAALRGLTDEEWNAAVAGACQIADRRAVAGRAQIDQMGAERRDLWARADELRRELG